MTDQLTLIDTVDDPWRLDERTREIGRLGVELARRALEEALLRAAA